MKKKRRLCWPHKTSWEGFSVFLFSEFVWDWHSFFLKCLVWYTSEDIWAYNFLWGKILLTDEISLFGRFRTIHISLSSCVFLGHCQFHLNFQMYWHKIVHRVLIPILISVEFETVSPFSFLIFVFLCFPYFFWSVLTEAYSFY